MILSPSDLHGQISAIPSKSDAHRLLICSALADRKTPLRLRASSEDIDATCRCLTALGAKITRQDGLVTVEPIREIPENPILDCGESGSTLRFMIPVAAAICPKASFQGRGRLPSRPLRDLVEAIEAHGVSFSSPCLPLTTKGLLTGGTYKLAGNVSSQYITGLLLALSKLGEASEIELTTPLESAAYIDITLHSLSRFGINIEKTQSGWRIPKCSRFHSPKELSVDGDWSNSSFFLAAGAIGNDVMVSGLDLCSPQGDKAILEVLSKFGAKVETTEDGIKVFPAPLHGCTVDVSSIPDALPILSIVASCAEGKTCFTNAARLRLKESDRLATTAAMLKAIGISATESPEGLTVEGGKIRGGKVDGANDHRIVMAAAIAATVSESEIEITDSHAVNKSYPAFFEDYRKLGGIANGI